MKNKINTIRLEVDSIATSIKNDSDNNLKDCAKNLFFAKAWCGIMLGELGNETPYKNDGNRKDVKDIEPTDSRNLTDKYNFSNFDNHVQRVDLIRQDIKEIIKQVVELQFEITNSTREFFIARTNAYSFLCNARFDLGFWMEKRREENEKQSRISN